MKTLSQWRLRTSVLFDYPKGWVSSCDCLSHLWVRCILSPLLSDKKLHNFFPFKQCWVVCLFPAIIHLLHMQRHLCTSRRNKIPTSAGGMSPCFEGSLQHLLLIFARKKTLQRNTVKHFQFLPFLKLHFFLIYFLGRHMQAKKKKLCLIMQPRQQQATKAC